MSDFNIATMLHDADNYVNENNFIEAGKIYSKITQLDNNCISAWYGLGICKAKLGEIGESISSLEQAHRINPDEGVINANLAYLLEKRDPERAVNFAKMAIENLGENDDLLRLSNLFSDIEIKLYDSSHKLIGKEEEIISLPAKSISEVQIEEQITVKDDENIDFVNSKTARYSRAQKMSEKGDHAAAVNEWKELLKKDSSDINSWKGLADSLSKAGYIERANQCLQRVEELTELENETKIIDESQEMENLITAAKEVKEKIKSTDSAGIVFREFTPSVRYLESTFSRISFIFLQLDISGIL